MARAETLLPLLPDLWWWHTFEDSVRTDLGSTAGLTEPGLLVVDPVDLAESALEQLSGLGAWFAIVLTNGNHARAAARYRTRFNLPIFCHPGAVGELEISIDGVLEDGDLLAGMRVIELEGAGAGEIALWDERGRLHVGDALVNLDSTGFSVLPERYCLDRARLGRSLRKLLPLEPKVITFAHGSPLLEGASERLRRLIDFSED